MAFQLLILHSKFGRTEKYQNLGILYYLIYNPNHWKRDKHQPLELYRLEEGEYILQPEEPYWLPEREFEEVKREQEEENLGLLGQDREKVSWANKYKQ